MKKMRLQIISYRSVLTAMALIPIARSFAPTRQYTYSYVNNIKNIESLTSPKTARISSFDLRMTSISSVSDLPDVKELSTAPFMKQVGYGAEMTSLLRNLNTENADIEYKNEELEKLKESLFAMLSHSDGIRGFMVAYLTTTATSNPDDEAKKQVDGDGDGDPNVLVETLKSILQASDEKTIDDLISLMLMNVIMPTAMVTMHQTEDLSNSSRLTAENGTRLLSSIFDQSSLIRENVDAILAAATKGDSESGDGCELVKYWNKFFAKWGYEEKQKDDIASAMKALLSSSSSSSSS